MAISENLSEFGGLEVIAWNPGDPLGDTSTQAYRISLDWDESDGGMRWSDKLYDLLDMPGAETIQGLIVGAWEHAPTGDGTSAEPVAALVEASDKLSNVRVLFVGDMTYEESEISWIRQSDLSALFAAFGKLEHFGARGGTELGLQGLHHDKLKTLVVQTGGLSAVVVNQIGRANLPQLEHLEIWFGSNGYGADATVDDIKPIVEVGKFPKLKYLGLRNSEFANEIAKYIADAPIMDQISVLDLSLGVLADEGADALLNSSRIKKLQKLDLHHHYLSSEVMAKFENLGIEVNLDEQLEADEYDDEVYRSVSVSE